MQMYQVAYTVYQGQGSQVLNEGTTMVPSSTGRMGAENAVKAMFNSNVNHVVIRSVFNA